MSNLLTQTAAFYFFSNSSIFTHKLQIQEQPFFFC